MISKLEKPQYFFIAHVFVKHGTAADQLKNFKKQFPTASDVNVIKSDTKNYLTFVATFAEPIDFGEAKRKLSFYYGGKSKLLAIHHSTKTFPTFFYSALLLQNFSPFNRHNGTVTEYQGPVKAAVALAAPLKTTQYTLHECAVLVESADDPIRSENVSAITTAMKKMPHHALLTSKKYPEKK